MKFNNKKTLLSMAVPLAAIMMSQSAMAAGTLAGTTVDNQASVAYSVNSTAQTPVSSDTATFVVDNKVDFTLVEDSSDDTATLPSQTGAITTFTLQNDGNSAQDFSLSVANLVGGTVFSDDTQDMSNFSFTGTNVLTIGTDVFVDDLGPDQSVTISVSADAPAVVVNGDAANIELTATVQHAGANAALGGTITNNESNTMGGVEVVWADAGNDGIETAQDGYLFTSAALVITKVAAVVSDPVNGMTNPKAIPGAVVHYTLTVENTGGQNATNVVISDDLKLANGSVANTMTLVPGTVNVNGTALTAGTGYTYDGTATTAGVLTVQSESGVWGGNVDATSTATITFDVTIL